MNDMERAIAAAVSRVLARSTPLFDAHHHFAGSAPGGLTTTPLAKVKSVKSASATAKVAKPSAGKKTGTSKAGSPDKVQHIAIGKITPNPDQPRKYFDPMALQELAASIKANGLLQPITVRPHEGGFQIVAGERRWRASQLNGATTVPALVKNLTDQQVKELSLIENLSRADMTPSETAKAFQGLLDGGMAVKDVARVTGKSDAIIRDHLALLNIEPHLQKLVDTGRLSMGLVGPLSKLSPQGREDAASRILSQDLAVKSAKRLIQSVLNKESQVGMFADTPVLSEKTMAAKSVYQSAIQQVTDALAKLDEETMTAMVPGIESPTMEIQRLGLMIKQLQRMQNALDAQRHMQETMMAPKSVTDTAHLAPRTQITFLAARAVRLRERLARRAA